MRRLIWITLAAASWATALAQDDDGTQVIQRIDQKFHAAYERSGAPIRDMLEESGLSVEDSGRIAESFIDGTLSCALDLAQTQAEEQSISYKEILLSFEQELDDPEVETPSLIEEAVGDEAAEACAMREMQKAGISMELAIQHTTQSSTDSQ